MLTLTSHGLDHCSKPLDLLAWCVRVSTRGVECVYVRVPFRILLLRRNSLEALVWEKEAEVDRFRDRWPMSMLVSRARMFNLIEENKPRDVLAALGAEKGEGGVAILAEARDCD